ncbi:MAG TPA: hypothetical protein VJN71_01735 [Nitrososphaerales archaeon]|nr:hypothetical protein [Nitrososphaerales archaeon]
MRAPHLSSNLITALIVGTFVILVVVGLLIANFGYYFFPSNTLNEPGISFSALQIFSGTNSSISYTGSCAGDAYLVVDMHNNTPNAIHVSNVTIYGPSLPQNATTLVTVSNNSCLPLSQSSPEIPPDSDYQFVGYLTIPIQPFTNCYFNLQLDNGQNISQLLVAQT